MRVLLINSSKSKGSNTELLVSKFKELAKDFKITEILTKDIKNCVGCRVCLSRGNCWLNDNMAKALESDFDAVIFCGAVYFFNLNSELSKALERFISVNMSNKIIGLILTSGSNFKLGGVDIILSQFERIDSYCGTITVNTFNKVTYDKRTPINENDILGLEQLIKDIEETERRLVNET